MMLISDLDDSGETPPAKADSDSHVTGEDRTEDPAPDAESNTEAGETIPPIESPEPAEHKLSRAERQSYDRAIRRFQVCGRCSYLLADFRLALGRETFESAILEDIRDGWLQLTGPDSFRLLIRKAYGISPDLNYEQYDGLCPECRRRITFYGVESGGVQVKLQA